MKHERPSGCTRPAISISELHLTDQRILSCNEGIHMKSTCPIPERRAKVPASSVTPDRILDAPLAQLLAETGAKLIDSTIPDRGFFGAVVERKSGELYLSMPAGRSDWEHDTVARYLLAQALDVGLPELPEPFVTTVI